ncbi:MAG: LapA family protein [Pseudomonadota bacterium]|nr:LapA family protein [Pseudomonadota bacterium]
MQIIRTVIWVLVLVALGLFTINNWQPVEVKLWEGIILETKLPALVIVSFLMGFLPMWLLHKGVRWRLNRRIGLMENTVKASSMGNPAPVATSTQLEAEAGKDPI